MPIQVKAIFGIRVSERTRLDLRCNRVGPLPDLVVQSEGAGRDRLIGFSDGGWTTQLEPGDHVLRIEVTDATWFSEDIALTLDRTSVLVVRRPDEPNPALAIVAWEATSSVIGGRPGGDPKDPWPPPASPLVASSEWLIDALIKLELRTVVRSASQPDAPRSSVSPGTAAV
jgi:hypothetical protein